MNRIKIAEQPGVNLPAVFEIWTFEKKTIVR